MNVYVSVKEQLIFPQKLTTIAWSKVLVCIDINYVTAAKPAEQKNKELLTQLGITFQEIKIRKLTGGSSLAKNQ